MKHKIHVYSLDNRATLGSDFLEENDWTALEEIADALEPFYQCTLELQGQAKVAQHGLIWKLFQRWKVFSDIKRTSKSQS